VGRAQVADDRQYLLAYYFHAKPNIIEALDVAVHENFYRKDTAWKS
jgi:hypothetical protein